MATTILLVLLTKTTFAALAKNLTLANAGLFNMLSLLHQDCTDQCLS